MNQIGGSDDHPTSLTAADPLAGLARWVAEGAVDHAAAERSRQRWLQQQASESTFLAGVLTQHAESSRRVVASTIGGRRTSGTITAVGVDFAVIREARLGEVILPLSQLAIVKVANGDDSPSGDAARNYDLMLAHALDQLAADRPSVLVAAGNEAVRGDLHSAGSDVITVQINGPQRSMVHVAIDAVDHVVVLAH